MKSFRLTNEIRDDILRQVMKSEKARYDAAEKEWRSTQNAFAEYGFKKLFKNTEEFELFEKCPDHWFSTTYEQRISINGNGNYRTVPFFNEEGRTRARPTPERYKTVLVYHSEAPVKQFLEAEAKWETIAEDYQKTRKQVEAVLKSFNSSKQLCLSWPEISTIVEQYAPFPRKVTAVGFPREELNKRLELPPEAA